ncbi:hypothetical protein GOBAR_AA26777 [Gossypium barbadense]|uniref:Uncharacterized protein n=1 Tax=Gossypium barbadense TaxID=3634 RepID=A0A2P5WS22_GOSBA|nr:hypothetical protein GOBAR_AA26777 [Gossypium barbadense]
MSIKDRFTQVRQKLVTQGNKEKSVQRYHRERLVPGMCRYSQTGTIRKVGTQECALNGQGPILRGRCGNEITRHLNLMGQGPNLSLGLKP